MKPVEVSLVRELEQTLARLHAQFVRIADALEARAARPGKGAPVHFVQLLELRSGGLFALGNDGVMYAARWNGPEAGWPPTWCAAPAFVPGQEPPPRAGAEEPPA